MRRQHLVLALCVLAVAAAASAQIPDRPEKLTYPGLEWNVPDPAPLRAVLANGVPVYIAEDRLLPLVTVQIMFRGGRYLEPAGKEGVAALTSTVWRTGGAADLDPAALDEQLDFLAAQLFTNVGDTTGMVSLNLLSKDLDAGLALLMKVMRSPRFEQARLDKAREDLISDLKRRNDDAADIENREWNRLLYGDGFWMNRLATKASVDGITREDLVAFHAQLANPANFVVAVAGDFARKDMLGKLNATLGAWKATGPKVPPVPQPTASARPGVYAVDKKDVNQGRVSLGHIGLRRPVPDEQALDVANDILGGGGFTAWMMKRIRSDEGLAYGAYSRFGVGDQMPGTFRAFFQSKSATCARAATLTLELIGKLRAGEASAKDLETSKKSFIETLPRTFETRQRTVQRFANDELLGLPHEYWTGYRARMAAVTSEAVKQAAEKYIRPDQLIVVIVGNLDEIFKGSPEHPDATFEKFGPITRLPLRDPLTLQPLAE
ncbi:MAG TPA: pitrilysin family protein [Thermoanaerobaculaceae bacterium]|mgnify:CR=1 FL=1|nr:pitrilysin family protein [Thermoanaerobaculaceae bacterium]HRS16406.1 pitrilysin family protein [Thermoanaerobaculaceae bacterium]